MAEIVLDHVVKRYPDGALAVDDFNLEIADGEFIILVGPSGCGKSTTLNMVAGLEDITGGKLIIDGQVVNDKAPKDRDIAMVFQSYALYPHMTVGENMGSRSSSPGWTRARRTGTPSGRARSRGPSRRAGAARPTARADAARAAGRGSGSSRPWRPAPSSSSRRRCAGAG